MSQIQIIRKKFKYLALNDNENTSKHADATKAVLIGKFIAVNIYIRGEERSKINYLNFSLKKLEKKRTLNPN